MQGVTDLRHCHRLSTEAEQSNPARNFAQEIVVFDLETGHGAVRDAAVGLNGQLRDDFTGKPGIGP